jgi:hypothetical protein
MKSTIVSLCFITLIFSKGLSQPLQTYSGLYKGDKDESGTATYTYIEIDDARIYQGQFSYWYTSYDGTTTIKGVFGNNKRTGIWTFSYKGKGGLNTWTSEEEVIDKNNYKIVEDQYGNKKTVYSVKTIKHNHSENVAASTIVMTATYVEGKLNGPLTINNNGKIKTYKFMDGKLADACISNYPIDYNKMLHGKITQVVNGSKLTTEYRHGFQLNLKNIDQSTGNIVINKKNDVDSNYIDYFSKYQNDIFKKVTNSNYYLISEKCKAELPFSFHSEFIPGHEKSELDLIKYSVIANSDLEFNIRTHGMEYVFNNFNNVIIRMLDDNEMKYQLDILINSEKYKK